MQKIDQLAAFPEQLAPQVKRLQGRPGFRLRVGDWRVIFDDNGNVLDVLAIGPRGSVYEP
ncbi:ParE-like toxin of type II ParDE toxin-antitoxin system [Phreatobacter oligotrophus]|jgi:mRNA interferase RelE/StbE|uniref:ParE-like toxin of type II ParDE toxin-antitoxin system n=2 Tax=Phreatobacter oligotrophus TaxID=1122261 RepID=A0A2T4ZGL6_9HYPH|nr:ParE-like toxin of type II ParDE toxin-antitoxin system [Phreatobacter oligotrophus]